MTVAPTVAELARRDPFWKVRADPRRADLELGTRADVVPYFVPVGSPLGREVVVDGAPRLMFGSNNYLGLADDPRVMEAARSAVDRYGSGCTGSRLMNGTLELHLELEDALARWMRRDAALVFSAGYLANLATLATLCDPDDVIVGDARNHASIEDGARLSGARTVTVRHDDLDQLETKLRRLDAPTMVVWDSVFSMEGDGENAPAVHEQARKSGVRARIFGPRDRMRRHEPRVRGKHRLKRRNDSALDRTNVRHDRPWPQRRGNDVSDRLVGANRRAQNGAIRATHGAGEIIGDKIAEPQGFRALQDRKRSISENDAARGVASTRGARDR